MEITTTLGALTNAVPVLQRLWTLRLPAKTAYHVSKLCKLVDAETRDHFHEPCEKLRVELGAERAPTPDEAATNGGQPVMEVTPENRKEFFTRVQELAAVEVTIPWKPLALDALASVDISADELNALGALIVSDGE